MASKFKTETIEVEKKINFLVDVDPTFVSLVRHGANRTPFRVIKSEEVKDEMMFVQSILVPKNVKISDIASKEGLEWLADATLESKEEFDEYTKFNQMPVSKFEKDLGMMKLDDSGVYALTGKLLSKEDVNNALTFEPTQVSKMMEVTSSPADTPIAEVERKPYVVSFKEMFEVELDNFLSVVRGTLNQSGLEPEKRKKTVMGALDGFKSFLTVALDAMNGNKKEDTGLETLNDKLEKIHNAIVNKGGGKDMTKEEVKAIVIETLTEKANEVVSKEQKKEEKPVEVVNKAEEKIDDLSLQVKDIASKMEALSQKQEAFGNQLISIPAAGKPNDKLNQNPEEKPKSVFSGLLTGKRG